MTLVCGFVLKYKWGEGPHTCGAAAVTAWVHPSLTDGPYLYCHDHSSAAEAGVGGTDGWVRLTPDEAVAWRVLSS